MNPKRVRFLIASSLAIGLAVGFTLGYFLSPKILISGTKSLRENTKAYTFIHPLLAVNRADETVPSAEYVSLFKNVENYLATQTRTKTLETASVYFINYGKTGSFSLNADEKYDPASMLKVVIMVAYLKQAESVSGFLNQRFVYTPLIQKFMQSIPFNTTSELVVGHSYTAEELIEKMIIKSDNGAMNLLLANIDDAYLTQVYIDLGLPAPQADTPYTISAREYSLFFRILYNATYLSSADSEKALSILSRATFKDGLVAGLPAGTRVAHKFGEHVEGQGDHINFVELHDCGITYVPNGP